MASATMPTVRRCAPCCTKSRHRFPTAAAPWGEGKNESHNWNSARGVIQDLAFSDASYDLNNGLFQANRAVKPEVLKVALREACRVEVVADPAKLQPFLRRAARC